ncbi:glycoside hydrolase family protein [Nostoc sp. NIES-4103]|nr:glycoside hydrolase family protein [Nostoc sp. NIES-4103]
MTLVCHRVIELVSVQQFKQPARMRSHSHLITTLRSLLPITNVQYQMILFKEENKLQADGIVGIKTWISLLWIESE